LHLFDCKAIDLHVQKEIKMSQNAEIPILKLLPSMHGRIREGHPWVFAESLKKHDPLPAGSLVRLMTDYDYDCGIGFYNAHSSIAIRLLHTHEDVNVEFFVNRLRSALAIRERVFPTVYGEIPDNINIQEHDIQLEISLVHGQKTGYFLDQRLNRKWVEQLSSGLDVLDCFTNQGGFALHAAKGGAKSVLGIDSAKQAIEASKRNAELNKYSHVDFEQADVFDFLKSSVQAGKTWDMIILDPPAFTKSKATLARAKRGYAEINRQALKLIRPGGFLVSASCSQHLSAQMLIEIVQTESKRVNRTLRLIHSGGQSPCHPILPIMPETSYLKCLTFEVQ